MMKDRFRRWHTRYPNLDNFLNQIVGMLFGLFSTMAYDRMKSDQDSTVQILLLVILLLIDAVYILIYSRTALTSNLEKTNSIEDVESAVYKKASETVKLAKTIDEGLNIYEKVKTVHDKYERKNSSLEQSEIMKTSVKGKSDNSWNELDFTVSTDDDEE